MDCKLGYEYLLGKKIRVTLSKQNKVGWNGQWVWEGECTHVMDTYVKLMDEGSWVNLSEAICINVDENWTKTYEGD